MSKREAEDSSIIGLKRQRMSDDELGDVTCHDGISSSVIEQAAASIPEDDHVQVVVEDAEVGEQFTVIPLPEPDQELCVDVNSANDDHAIDESISEQQFDSFSATYDEQAENDDDFKGQFQPVVVQHMDIAQPLTKLRELLEIQLNISLDGYEFWLQDSIKLDAHKNLTSQCVQGCGLVQVNVEIKTVLGGSPRINITDVLKPADEDDDLEMKPDIAAMPAPLRPHKYKPRAHNRTPKSARVPMMPHAENVTRWIVDQHFRETQMQLGIPLDPMEWSMEHVKFWLEWAITQFSLDGVAVDQFDLSGTELCQLSHDDFIQLVPNDVDNIFWTHLELLRKCKFVAVMQPPGTTPVDLNFSGVRKYSSLHGRGNRTGNNGQIQLWQFLLELLTDRQYSEIIEWMTHDGEFKLHSAETVAQMWGQRKNKPTMNYEKLSRALRYYYDNDMITKVHGKRFVYKFVCDLVNTIGYSPADIQQLIALSAAENDLHATGAISENTESATVKLERLRELLRTPGAVRRCDSRTVTATIPVVVAPEDLIVDGTS